MTAKRFAALVKVSNEFLREASGDAENEAKKQLRHALSELRGPRGGRYEPVGDIQWVGWFHTDDDLMRNVWSYGGKRLGRYVRPNR